MNKRSFNKNYNKTIITKGHLHKFGDFLFQKNESGKIDNRSLNNLSNTGQTAISVIGASAPAIGGIIGGGMTSGAGNTIQGLANIAQVIPGPYGQMISAGLNIGAGLTNRFIGSKRNEENIAKVEANIDALNSFQSNASTFDSLAQNWSNAVAGMEFNNNFIGKDGIWSDNIKNLASDYRNQINQGEMRVQRTLTNNADNITNNQLGNLLRYSSAYGGPLNSNGSTWDNGLIYVNNGGTHEENPYEGVQMGIAQDGIPNLVEEGEIVWNDYVFSNRTKVPKSLRTKYKLGRKKSISFADAVDKLSKESKEIVNDPIVKNTLDVILAEFRDSQEQLRIKNQNRKLQETNSSLQSSENLQDQNTPTQDQAMFYDENMPIMAARGGKLGKIFAGENTDPDSNQLNGVPVRQNFQASTRVPVNTFLYPGTYFKSTQDIINRISEEDKFHNNVIDHNEVWTSEYNPANRNKEYKEYKDYNKSSILPTWQRYAPIIGSGATVLTDAFGLTNKPDYREANNILQAYKATNLYRPVKTKTIGNYLKFKPLDRDQYLNALNAQSGATRRNILNTTGLNSGAARASLLAADYNALNAVGESLMKQELLNREQAQKIEEFNRATNASNSESALKADISNQDAWQKARNTYLTGITTAAGLKLQERQAAAAARSAHLSNFINSLGELGRENFTMNMINQDPSKYYIIGPNGEIIYKPKIRTTSGQ